MEQHHLNEENENNEEQSYRVKDGELYVQLPQEDEKEEDSATTQTTNDRLLKTFETEDDSSSDEKT